MKSLTKLKQFFTENFYIDYTDFIVYEQKEYDYSGNYIRSKFSLKMAVYLFGKRFYFRRDNTIHHLNPLSNKRKWTSIFCNHNSNKYFKSWEDVTLLLKNLAATKKTGIYFKSKKQ